MLLKDVLMECLARMSVFNTQHPSREGAMVVTKLEEAMMWMNAHQAKQDMLKAQSQQAAQNNGDNDQALHS